MVVRVRGRVTLRRRYVTVYTANIFVRAETRVQGSLTQFQPTSGSFFKYARMCADLDCIK